MDSIILETKKFIIENELINPKDRLLLSLSAGKDSVCLLNILSFLKVELNFSMGIFHLNHLTRGIESDLDEDFVNDLALKFEIPFYTEKYDFTKNKVSKMSFEEQARFIRYDFLKKTAVKNNFNKIVTAHNNDDQIETIVMRIFSGTSLHGLEGIKAKRDNIIRPLLFLTSQKIYDFLQQKGIGWREDSSNKDNKYLRNFIRNEALPILNDRFKGLNRAINNLANIAQENNLLLNELTKKIIDPNISQDKNSLYLNLTKELKNIIFLKYIIVKLVKERFKKNLEAKALDEICKNIKVDRANLLLYENKELKIEKIFIDKTLKIKISLLPQKKTIKNWEYKVEINQAKSIDIKEINKTLYIEMVDYNFFKKHQKEINFCFLSFSEDVKIITIRNRRQGDKIKIKTGTKKIKELLIEQKFNETDKNLTPLLVVNSQIAACLLSLTNKTNNRISNNFLVNQNSKKILNIFLNKI